MRANKWVIITETQAGRKVLTIRRWVYRKPNEKPIYERLPIEKYHDIRHNSTMLKEFVTRLNANFKIPDAIEIRHAFISPTLLDQYREFLLTQIPNQGKAIAEFGYLKRYFLNFFITTMNQPDPVTWHKNHKTVWAKYLQSKDCPASADTKKDIVRAANRFIQWLHEQRPTEVPPLKFQPITKAKYKEIEAFRGLRGEIHEPKFIKDKDWGIISSKLPSTIRSTTLLAYHFGLRRSEALGLQVKDVRNTVLSVERQLEGVVRYTPLKGRETRKVPYWDTTPEAAYGWCQSLVVIHPDTLTEVWGELMDASGFDYTFHDLRHTWITRMIRKHAPRDVQLAAGHKSIDTTMSYLHDDREMGEEVFVPKKNVS